MSDAEQSAETTDHEKMVNSLVLLDEPGGHIEYDGPFEFVRDGGQWNLGIPVDLDHYAGIGETTAENLTDRVGDMALALADGAVEASGRIAHAEVIEGTLLFAVDDGNRVSPSDVDVDLSEVDR